MCTQVDMILCAQGPCTRPRGPKSLKPIETRRRDPCEGRGGPRGARRFPVGYLHRGVGAGFGVVHTQVQVELRPGDNGPLLSTPLHFLEQSWRFIEKTHQGKNKQPTKKVLRVRTLRIRSLQTFGGEQTVETDFKRSLCALVSRFAFFVSSHYRVILAPKSMFTYSTCTNKRQEKFRRVGNRWRCSSCLGECRRMLSIPYKELKSSGFEVPPALGPLGLGRL